MKITKWEPFNRLDRFFDDSFPVSFSGLTRVGFDMAVDIYEEKDSVIAKMSLPGIEVSELDISIEDNILSISGTREEESEIDQKDYHSKEIRRGSFSRSVTLPKTVDAHNAKASYKKGELIITVPVIKGIDDKSVKIPITS